MTLVDFKGRKYYLSSLLKENLDIYKDAVITKNTSVVLVNDGRSGNGKTTLSFQIACYLDPNFNLDKVCFTPEQFIEALQKAKKGDVIVFDEAMIISNRSTMSAMNRAIIIMMSQIRSKNIFVIFNINSIFDLDKNLALHRADCLLHVYAEHEKIGNRGRYAVFPSSKGKLKQLYIFGKKYYSYAKPKAVFKDRFTAYFPFDNDEYERRKQEAINSFVLAGDKNNSKIAKQRNLLVRYISETYKLKTDEIAKICNVNIRTIQRILTNQE